MTDVRLYFNQECYGLKNCLHCQNIIAFALNFLDIRKNEKNKSKDIKKFKKFIIETICRENFFCENALPFKEINNYLDKLISNKEKLPIIDYELGPNNKT